MRFHATTEAAEGQCCAALQQGGLHGNQRPLSCCICPVIRLVAAGPCVRLRVLSVARPGIACWQHHSADVREEGWGGGGVQRRLFISMRQMLNVFHRKNKSNELRLLFKTFSTPVFFRGRVSAIQQAILSLPGGPELLWHRLLQGLDRAAQGRGSTAATTVDRHRAR